MGPAARHGACWIPVLVLVAVACDVPVQTGLTEQQASTVAELLRAHHVSARATRDTQGQAAASYCVRVPRDDVPNAVATLAASDPTWLREDTPARSAPTAGLIPTPEEERARMATASATRIERAIRLWDGVIAAQVQLTPAREGHVLGGAPVAPRAAVVVKHQPGRAPDIGALKRLVASGDPLLKADDVVVVQLEASPPPAGVLVQLGPIAVTRGSAPWLKAALATSLTLTGVLAVLLVWSVRRNAR